MPSHSLAIIKFSFDINDKPNSSLTDAEVGSIGQPTQWSVLSAQAMDAAVRFTQDRRLMIRKTEEVR